MALTITKLKMWKDPGYTRGCVEVPPVGSKKLPAVPDYTLAADETLRPHKGSTLTELHLPLSFTQTFGMSYLYIEATDGAGSVSLFGWITSIDQRSTAAEGVTIRWDVDWWRSYSGNITFKSGTIVKSPDSTHKRPYRTQPRYWKIDSVQYIRENTPGDLWVYVPIVWTIKKNDEKVITRISTFFAPLNGQFFVTPQGTPGQNTPLYGPDADFLYSGFMDEFVAGMGSTTDTVSVLGVYIAPITPDDFVFNGTAWYPTNTTYAAGTYSDTGTSFMFGNGPSPTATMTYSITAVKTDDTTRVHVTDTDGNSYGILPYGVSFDTVDATLDIGSSGGYLNLTFRSSELFTTGMGRDVVRKVSNSVGCGFSIPLPTVPVTENQWSDYMITCQRSFDVESARIANEQKAISGIESTAQSAIGGGVAGASAGPIGAIVGAVSGAAVTGIMTGINYGLGENYNKQLQDARDLMYANQKNGLILTGNSYNKMVTNNASYPMLVILTADSVSATEINDDITLNGYDVNLSGDLSSIITPSASGPYRIVNMTVTGDIPPQAKQYIKDRFVEGVRIIENNPSGVVP